ncbi:hypothetical protein [Bacillus alkalicellulosilyticus]|uniref:hypothetical protein n=1 Tax=Alkalihalobacterium alkalicellulosilyticum TaxID=1912214 RepID=UPI001482D3CE|nr:hypothetical protein [Bacillus alkalicellulosilyticus]
MWPAQALLGYKLVTWTWQVSMQEVINYLLLKIRYNHLQEKEIRIFHSIPYQKSLEPS